MFSIRLLVFYRLDSRLQLPLAVGAHSFLQETSSEPVSCLRSAPSNQREGKKRIGISTSFIA